MNIVVSKLCQSCTPSPSVSRERSLCGRLQNWITSGYPGSTEVDERAALRQWPLPIPPHRLCRRPAGRGRPPPGPARPQRIFRPEPATGDIASGAPSSTNQRQGEAFCPCKNCPFWSRLQTRPLLFRAREGPKTASDSLARASSHPGLWSHTTFNCYFSFL